MEHHRVWNFSFKLSLLRNFLPRMLSREVGRERELWPFSVIVFQSRRRVSMWQVPCPLFFVARPSHQSTNDDEGEVVVIVENCTTYVALWPTSKGKTHCWRFIRRRAPTRRHAANNFIRSSRSSIQGQCSSEALLSITAQRAAAPSQHSHIVVPKNVQLPICEP